MSKRLTAGMIVVVALVLMLSTIAGAAKTKLEIWVWGGEPWETVWQEFQDTHPDIELSFLPLTGSFDERKQKLLTAVVGGMAPDVVLVDRFEASQWASFDTLMPLDQLMERDGFDRSAYMPPTIEEGVFPWDGKTYALPFSTDCRVIYWNKAIFREAGLDPDYFPESWEDQMELNKKLGIIDDKGNVQRVGFAVVEGLGANGGEWALGWSNGGEYMTEGSTKVTLNDPKIVEALEWLVDMTDASGGVEKTSSFQATWGAETQGPFFTGKIAAMLNGTWNFGDIARYAPDMELGVSQMYSREALQKDGSLVPISFAGGHAMAIPRGARNVDEAYTFISWLAGLEGQRAHIRADQAFSNSLGRPWVPPVYPLRQANQEAYEALLATENVSDLLKEGYKTAIATMEYARFRDRSPAALFMQQEFIGRARDEALHHRKTPQAALDDATAAIQAELDRLIKEWEGRMGKSLR
mgnify:CR=1 FL=1